MQIRPSSAERSGKSVQKGTDSRRACARQFVLESGNAADGERTGDVPETPDMRAHSMRVSCISTGIREDDKAQNHTANDGRAGNFGNSSGIRLRLRMGLLSRGWVWARRGYFDHPDSIQPERSVSEIEI